MKKVHFHWNHLSYAMYKTANVPDELWKKSQGFSEAIVGTI